MKPPPEQQLKYKQIKIIREAIKDGEKFFEETKDSYKKTFYHSPGSLEKRKSRKKTFQALKKPKHADFTKRQKTDKKTFHSTETPEPHMLLYVTPLSELTTPETQSTSCESAIPMELITFSKEVTRPNVQQIQTSPHPTTTGICELLTINSIEKYIKNILKKIKK